MMQSRMRHSQADSRSQRKPMACLSLDLRKTLPLDAAHTIEPPFPVWSQAAPRSQDKGKQRC